MAERNRGNKAGKGKFMLKQAAGILGAMLVGGALGAVIAFYAFGEGGSGWGGISVMVLSVFISFFLHIILHEGGHLVCGLLSGYRFVSYRAGSIIWVKQGEKIVRKKFSIPGTGGQCLLDPPKPAEDGSFPSLLYNLGGGLSNLLFCAAAILILAVWGERGSLLTAALVPFIVFGIYLGAANLIPLKIGGIANDGYNIRTFRADRESARAFWIQLRINKLQQTDGIRLSEMPEEYFAVPEDAAVPEEYSAVPEKYSAAPKAGQEDALEGTPAGKDADGPGNEDADTESLKVGNPLIDAVRVMKFQRMIDEKRFEEAELYGRQLLKSPKLLGQYRNMISQELLFLELAGPCRKEEVERLYSPALKKYFKLVSCYPGVHRVMYAYAVRYSHDEAQAEKEKKAFEKAVKNYPAQGEIRAEQELMEVI